MSQVPRAVTNIVIGFSGKMGTGKNYIAEKVLPAVLSKVIPDTQYYYMAFGDQIKVELGCRRPHLTYDLLFEKKTKDVRQLLQQYGTENGRNVHGEHIWIKSLDLWMDIYKHRSPDKNNIFVVTDVRFKNEAKWVEDNNGILIRVDAPIRNEDRIKQEESQDIKNHVSEVDLDDYDFKNIINNEHDQVPKTQLEHIIAKYYK